MRNIFLNTATKTVGILLLLSLLYSCGSVVLTGRNQVLLFSDQEIMSLSDQSYLEFKKEAKGSINKNYINSVNQVGIKITEAVKSYLRSIGGESAINGMQWSFEVIQSDQINAFCMPNGKIVFYEGIMKIANSPDMIAVVMGHEVAHAIAKHGNERMSREAIVGTTGSLIGEMIGTQNQKNQAIFNVAFNVGTTLGVVLPYSRKQEYEADKIGLIIMSMAGYNIEAAPKFWESMMGKSASKPEFLSTHPSDNNRIVRLKESMSEAAKYAKKK